MKKKSATNGKIVQVLCYKKFFYLILMLISNEDPGKGKVKGVMRRFSNMIGD